MHYLLLLLLLNSNGIKTDCNKYNKILKSEKSEKIYFRRYKDTYIVTGFGSQNNPAFFAKEKEHNQVKFQFSFKYYLISNLWFGFTQKSVWDIWDIDRSSPFQDTNYNPELFYELKSSSVLGIDYLKSFKVGIEHESNGKSKDTKMSRSWNRIYSQVYLDVFKYLKIDFKLWVTFDLLIRSLNIVDNSLFENNDIGEYYGNFKLKIITPINKNLNIQIALQKGNSLDITKGQIELGVDFRIPITYLRDKGINPRFYLQLFSGYGETLLNYNKQQLKYRVGFMFPY